MVSLLKSIRSAIAGLLLLLCVGIVLLWPITSDRDFELFNNVSEFELYCIESWNGKLRVSHSVNSGKSSEFNVWRFWSVSERRMKSDYSQYWREWNASPFEATWNQEDVALALPHLIWAALTLLFAFLIKPVPKFQFAFQDLLIMIAIIAIIVAGLTLTNRAFQNPISMTKGIEILSVRRT